MNFENKLNELNRLANEISKTLYIIYISHLNNFDTFSYETVKIIKTKYEKTYNKITKSKNKLIKYKYNIPDFNKILNEVSKKIIEKILLNIENYIPKTKKEKEEILQKLIPIFENLDIFSITCIYKIFKEKIYSINNQESYVYFIYLQQMFITIIINKIQEDKYKNMELTYGEICKNILKESILNTENYKIREKNKKTSI